MQIVKCMLRTTLYEIHTFKKILLLTLLQRNMPGFFYVCPLWQNFFLTAMKMETDPSTPKCSLRLGVHPQALETHLSLFLPLTPGGQERSAIHQGDDQALQIIK